MYKRQDIICFDCETTGLDHDRDEIIEVAAVRVDIVNRHHEVLLNQLVNPEMWIPPESSGVNNITNEMVRGQPTWVDVQPLIRELLNPNMLALAHNAFFDSKFVMRGITELEHRPLEWIDTLRLVRHGWPNVSNHKLTTMIHALDIDTLDNVSEYQHLEAHRAAYDAYATCNILCEAIEKLEINSVEDLVKVSNKPALMHNCPLFKYKDQPWEKVPYSYLKWAHGCNFDGDLGYTVNYYLMRIEKIRHNNAKRQLLELKKTNPKPVSYTHLTLPTIYSV